MKKDILALQIFLLTSFYSAGQIPKTFIRAFASVGIASSISNIPDVIMVEQERKLYPQILNQYEYQFNLGFINIGPGAGLILRPNMILPKIFSSFELHSTENRGFASFRFEIGLVKGSIEKKMWTYINAGPIFNFNKNYKKVNFSLSPTLDYYSGETADRVAYDCRIQFIGGPPCYTRGKAYQLNFRTFVFNLNFVCQFNRL